MNNWNGLVHKQKFEASELNYLGKVFSSNQKITSFIHS